MTEKKVNSEILDRLPPQDLEAEKAVLGSLLCDPRVCDDVALIVKPADFYADANAKIYATILDMQNSGGRFDVLLLRERLKTAGELEGIGGAAYLAEVTGAVPYAANAVFYSKIVRKAAVKRALIHTATEIIRDAYDSTSDADELVQTAESSLLGLQTSDTGERLKSAADAAMDANIFIDEVFNNQNAAGLMTGLDIFDENFGGLFPKELCILAARPSVGKTSLARQIAQYAGEHGRAVYFVSLEMDVTQQTILSLCTMSGVDSMRVRNGSMNEDEKAALAEASNRYGQASIFMEDRPRMKTRDILRTARRLKKKGLRLIVVDYLQLIQPSDKKVDRYLQVGEIARDLKQLAMELDIPVLCLAQLNREACQGKEPELHNLKESGDVEQHADVVMFLHDGYLLVKKNRNGPKGKIKLNWQPDLTTFSCADEPRPANYDNDLAAYGG